MSATETLEAKLRNQLTPFYTLSGIITAIELNPDKAEELKKIVKETAIICENNKPKINELLLLIEAKK